MKLLVILGSTSVSAGYVKVDRAGLGWNGAKAACEEKGLSLVTFDDEAEFNSVMEWLGDSTAAYWTGYRDDFGIINPEGYTRFSEGEPNNKQGDEHCIRLRFGAMNDALCEIYWAGPKKQNIGMGYICEGESVETALEVDGAAADRELGMMIGEQASVPEIDFPTHIMSNVYRSNKKPDAKLSTGVFEIMEGRFEHGRPVYHNPETNIYLSYSFNPAEQIESDGKWKFSSFNAIGQSLAGHVFIHSQSDSPDQIQSDASCFWFKPYGPKKKRQFRKVNCIYDPEFFGFDGEEAIGVNFEKGPKSKLSLLNGVYTPINLDTIEEAFQKLGSDMYAIKRNDRWEFVEPRGIHSSKYFATIESNGALADVSGSDAYLGKKKTSAEIITFN